MVDFARALSGARHRHHHLQFPLHRTRPAGCPIARPVLESLLSRGDRGVPAGGRERAPVPVHRRQVDGRTHRDAGRGRRSGTPARTAWCCSAIRCTRPAGRPNAATRICRRSAGRCCSCRAAATRSARRASWRRSWRRSRRRRRSTSSRAAITRSRSGAGIPRGRKLSTRTFDRQSSSGQESW